MGIPIEFIVFGLVLLGVAVFHNHPLTISLGGLAAVLAIKLFSPDFHLGPHLRGEAALLANLFGLLLGFAALARHFEASRLPLLAPLILPDDWKGPLVLLILVWLLSAFLDNIAAALVGGAVAATVFRGRVHIGYLAAIVAASNGGGAGSVLGDTTTTMMWIAGVPAAEVLHGFIGSGAALICFGIPASLQQHRHQPILANPVGKVIVDWRRVGAVATVLIGAMVANLALDFPAAGVWVALLLWAPFVGMPWKVMPQAARGALFLASLVLIASLMPVEKLPAASWPATLALGFVSAFFDNIPLTKLALDQGGYDWGLLAYAVGFGGSILWFGSSAGVALSGAFPSLRSVGAWLRNGWYIAPAYVAGFFIMLAIAGWHPHPLH
ncbi:MAG: sodium/proton antiporter, NhaD family [Fibrobacteres bacterium]|nr:sodium/proton antiporter, NhaD family [Fibrobacterota bacterium]